MEELIKELLYWQAEESKAVEHIKIIKGELEKNYLTDEGYKDDLVTISYSKPSTSTSIDLKALENKEPDLYKELLDDYKKVTERKGSYRYSFK